MVDTPHGKVSTTQVRLILQAVRDVFAVVARCPICGQDGAYTPWTDGETDIRCALDGARLERVPGIDAAEARRFPRTWVTRR